MARNEIRPIVKLRRPEPVGAYVTHRNGRNNATRMTVRKYGPVIRRHVDFREER